MSVPSNTHGNAWLAVSVAVNGVSEVIQVMDGPRVTIFGKTSINATLQVQVSEDEGDPEAWYDYETISVKSNGHFTWSRSDVAAHLVRLKLLSTAQSQPAVITATVSCK